MRAVILAGGLGTRLRPYTTVIPKPLVPIGDRPVLEHIIQSLTRSGVDQIDLCVSHLGQLICVYLANADLPRDVRLSYHWESEPLGTAGALSGVPDLEGTFIAMNGDVLTTLDFETLVDYHFEQDAALTVAVRGQPVHVDLGVIESENGLVCAYREKPTLRFKASMGVYVFDARALKQHPAGAPIPDSGARTPAPGGGRARRCLRERRRLVRHRDRGRIRACRRGRGALPREVRARGVGAAAHGAFPAMQARNSGGVR